MFLKYCNTARRPQRKGKEFQIIGPVTVKALSPNVFKLDLGTINNFGIMRSRNSFRDIRN